MRTVVAAIALVLVAAVVPAGPVAAVPETLLWDTAWSLPNRATPAEIEEYFDHLAANGFSGVWIMTAPHYWQGGMAAANYAGEAMESFTSPNPEYLAHIDFLLDEAAARGLQLALAIAWTVDYAGVRPGAQGKPVPPLDDWFDPDDPNVGQKAFDYGYLVGERWGGHPGVYAWVLGGDYWWGDSELLTEETVVQMAAGLEAAGALEPVTYGPGGGSGSWHLFADDPWVDIVSFNNHCMEPEDLQAALEGLAVYGKPVVAAEVRYEADAAPFCNPVREITPADIRADVEATVAAGAAGYVYGHHDRWAWDPPAMSTLGSPGELEAMDVLGLPPEPEPPAPTSEVVLVEPGGRWHLRMDGRPDWTFWFGVPGDTPLLGDWDGDGVATPGMFRPSNGYAYLTNVLPADGSVAFADPGLSFFYGMAGDQVFVGDWDGDGRDSLGISRNGKMFLRNANSTGPADVEFWFGHAADIAVGGKPAGGASDGLFLYRPSNGMVYYTAALPAGELAQTDGSFGIGAVDGVFVGDWDGNGTETVGTFHAGRLSLRNTNAAGPPDASYDWGLPVWRPVAGTLGHG